MELTEENKKRIDAMSYENLLERWRNAPAGDPWFQGNTGKYWRKRMEKLRSQPGGNDKHVSASKKLAG